MRFRFESSGKSLPVIPIVPDHKLSTIEGRNGIGKTLAARILEFITDGEPFVALPKAWESFGRDLGKLTVTIDGFPSGETVRCELDGASWAGRREEDCVGSPGLAFINDKPAEWAAVHRLIKVRRIAGDEGLTETLARTLRESSVVARRRDEETSAAVNAFGDQLRQLTDDLVQVRVAGHSEEVEEYRRLSAEYGKAAAKANAAEDACGQAVDALDKHEHLVKNLEGLPRLLTEYADALAAHKEAETASIEADKALTEIGRKQEVDAKKAEDIKWLLKRRPYRLDQLASAQVDEQRAHARLGVTTRLKRGDISDRVKAIDERLRTLEEENRTADMAGTVRNVQTTLLQELTGMPKRAQNERIATIGRDIRVHELADGIAARRKQLEGIPKPDEVAHRESEMASLKFQKMWLAGLFELYRKTDAKKKLVDGGERDLAALRGDADDQDALLRANTDSATARGNLMQAAVAVSEAQAGIKAAIGLEELPDKDPTNETAPDLEDEELDNENLPVPRSVDEVEDEVRGWLEKVEATLDPRYKTRWTKAFAGAGSLATKVERGHAVVEGAVTALRTEIEELSMTFQNASAVALGLSVAQDQAMEVVANRLERLGVALRVLADDAGPWSGYRNALQKVVEACGLPWEDFADLVESPPVLSDLLADEPRRAAIEKSTRVVETVSMVTSELETSAARVRDQWSNTANYLYRFSSELSARLEDNPYDSRSMRASAGDILTKWAENTISDLLSTPELRTELFDESPVVSFNIKDLTVSWTEGGTKRRRRRPLEAFSSGEQVFAYTKAKLERLSSLHDSTDNVVVFLDEFGAFVARDRFAQLVTYIQHDALGRIADQIVVTVPLSGDLHQVRDNAALAKVEAEVFDPPGYVVIPARVD